MRGSKYFHYLSVMFYLYDLRVRFGPTLRPSLRRLLNPVLPHRPAVLDVHELIYCDVRQREADRYLLRLRLAHRRAAAEIGIFAMRPAP